jgi:hypothetical protein
VFAALARPLRRLRMSRLVTLDMLLCWHRWLVRWRGPIPAARLPIPDGSRSTLAAVLHTQALTTMACDFLYNV